MKIISTNEEFILKVTDEKISKWERGIGASIDCNANGVITGIEVQLYTHEIENCFIPLKGPYHFSFEMGILYYFFQTSNEPPGKGFGRTLQIGIDTNSCISEIRFLWNEPMSSYSPKIDPKKSLEGIKFVEFV